MAPGAAPSSWHCSESLGFFLPLEFSGARLRRVAVPGFSLIYGSSWISRRWNGSWQGVNQSQSPQSRHSQGCVPAEPLAFLLLPSFTKSSGKPECSAAPEMLPTGKALLNSIKDGKSWICDEKLGGRRVDPSGFRDLGFFRAFPVKTTPESKLSLPSSRSMEFFHVFPSVF